MNDAGMFDLIKRRKQLVAYYDEDRGIIVIRMGASWGSLPDEKYLEVAKDHTSQVLVILDRTKR